MLDRLLDFLLSILDLGRFWIVVDVDEGGVLLRLGQFNRILDPGFHWKWPLGVDRERVIKTVRDTYNLSAQGLTTLDGKQVAVAAIVTFRIVDVQKALLDVTDLEGVIKDSVLRYVAQAVLDHDWDTIRTSAFCDKLTALARRPAFRAGVEILSVAFSDVTTTWNHTQIQVQ